MVLLSTRRLNLTQEKKRRKEEDPFASKHSRYELANGCEEQLSRRLIPGALLASYMCFAA